VSRTILNTLLAVVLAVGWCTAAAGQDTGPARFFIERIEVREASRVSPEVVISESRLREGQEYRESELSDAAARLGRLPFLLSADFSLEKGSDRGRYVLVISVVETKPFFYLLDVRPVLSETDNGGSVDIELGDRLGDGDNEGVIGARWFVGRRGAFHAGVFARDDNQEFTQDYTAAVVGYTQYDLFGTRAFATLNLKRPLIDIPGGDVSPQLVVGIPVTPNQTVTLTFDDSDFGTDLFSVDDEEQEQRNTERLVSARWAYNTTDDPFTPARGSLLTVTPFVTWRDLATFGFFGELDERVPFHVRSFGLDVKADHYIELSDRNSVSLGAEGGWARGHETSRVYTSALERDATYAIARAGFSHSIWTREEQKRGDSRFEYSARWITRDRGLDAYRFSGSTGRDDDRFQLAWAWVRRSSFGTLRLGVGYGW
jgi:outer membrane protein assembly factor BamA